MPRTINDLYNFYQYIVRKQRSVFVTIPQFNSNMDAGQLDALLEYMKLYGVDDQIHDAIRPFRAYYQFTSNSAGMVTYPSDYFRQLGTAFTVTGSTVNEITFVNEDDFVSALTSQLRPVSNEDPIARDTNNGFSIYPQQSQIGFFTYMRRPAIPVLSVTQVGRVVTYNAGSSVQLEWLEIYWNNILAKALRYAGVNMTEPEISKFAEDYNAQTQ